jgi:hypothetical protein
MSYIHQEVVERFGRRNAVVAASVMGLLIIALFYTFFVEKEVSNEYRMLVASRTRVRDGYCTAQIHNNGGKRLTRVVFMVKWWEGATLTKREDYTVAIDIAPYTSGEAKFALNRVSFSKPQIKILTMSGI